MDEVTQFLQQNKQEISDNGFSERVMETIPAAKWDWDRILQVICYIIVASVVVFGGGEEMLNEMFANSSTLKDLLLNLAQNCLYIIVFAILVSASTVYNFKDGFE